MARFVMEAVKTPSRKVDVRDPDGEGEVAARLLEEHGYGKRRQTAQNGQWEFRCPFHEEPGSPSVKEVTKFYLNARTSQYMCMSGHCGEQGNLVTLQRFFNIEDGDDTSLSARYKTKDTALQEYQANLTDEHRSFLQNEKGLTKKTVDHFRIGYDTTRKAYVIPYLEFGRPTAFRFYDPIQRGVDEKDRPTYGGPNGSKYWWEKADESIETPEDDIILRLYNRADSNGDEGGQVFICEGEFKAMLLAQWGYRAVGIPGVNGLKREWAQFFMHARQVFIVMDNDNPEFHKRKPGECVKCDKMYGTQDCKGHNPGQEGAAKIADFFGFRAHNVVLPLPAGVKKTDINEYAARDGGDKIGFIKLVLGESGAGKYHAKSLAEIRNDPPDETVFLVDKLLPLGGRLLVTGAPKVGKAQPLTSEVLTPTGWVKMADVSPGSEVIGSYGQAIRVTHVWPQGELNVFRITTSDGAQVRATAEHLWKIRDRSARKKDGEVWEVITTSEMTARLSSGHNMYLPVISSPVEFARSDYLPIDPYALGALIGDGSFRMGTPSFTSGDEEMFDLLADSLPAYDLNRYRPEACCISDPESSHIRSNRLTADLHYLGLWSHRSETKFIPDIYKYASPEDRLALLQGLMDTDGGMENMRSTYATSSSRLASDVRELVESLGGIAKTSRKPTSRLDAYVLNVRLPTRMCPFRLTRKREAWASSRPTKNMGIVRRIVSVEPDGSEEAQCITVDSPDSLYVTESCVVTHNSIFIENLVLSLAAGIPFLHKFSMANNRLTPGHRVLLLDRELSKRSLFDRFNALIDDRPGYAVADEKLLIDHDFQLALDQPGAADDLISLIRENNAEVVVLDTAYKFFANGDMESSAGLSRSFAAIDKAIKETGASFILTHHHRKGSNDKNEAPSADSVVGSFLWTGWANGTVLLNFKNRSVKDPYTTIASCVAFRDCAAPEPLLLKRDKTSLGYTEISDYVFDDEDSPSDKSGNQFVVTNRPKLTTEGLADLLMQAVPIEENEFLHVASAHFKMKPENVRINLIDIHDRSKDFVRQGDGTRNKPYIWRYAHDKIEETYTGEPEVLGGALAGQTTIEEMIAA